MTEAVRLRDIEDDKARRRAALAMIGEYQEQQLRLLLLDGEMQSLAPMPNCFGVPRPGCQLWRWMPNAAYMSWKDETPSANIAATAPEVAAARHAGLAIRVTSQAASSEMMPIAGR
jgi:hypothetical protein